MLRLANIANLINCFEERTKGKPEPQPQPQRRGSNRAAQAMGNTPGGQTQDGTDSKEGAHFQALTLNPSRNDKSNIKICERARVLKKLNYNILWDMFLANPTLYASFALTQQETETLLFESLLEGNKQALNEDGNKQPPVDKDAALKEIKSYVQMVEELSEKHTSNSKIVVGCSIFFFLQRSPFLCNQFATLML